MEHTMTHFLTLFEEVTRKYWNEDALSNFQGKTYTYAQMAEEIARLHRLFAELGIKPGDKIAVCGRNSAEWAIAFLAANAYHAVAVPLLANFTAESITRLCNHAECAMLLVDGKIFRSGVQPDQVPTLKVVMNLDNAACLYSSDETYAQACKRLAAPLPAPLTPNDIHYASDDLEELCIISYTSGTTGNPKGIMLPSRAISANIDFAQRMIPSSPRVKSLSMLPLAHMFGFVFEFLYPFLGGAHIVFLGKMPTPSILMQAFAEVKPYLFITVPLVMEKLIKGKVMPVLRKPAMRVGLALPFTSRLIYRYLNKKLTKALGGNVVLIPMGGAAISQPVERLLRKIGLPFTVGYGMTECAPLVGYTGWETFVPGSCGRCIDTLEMRIDSIRPDKVVGEIQVRGTNVMLGYYKDPEATKAAFTDDGWMHTGDLGIIDKHGNIFLKGRSKCMILTSNGQNIYPEEIESRLNDMPHIAESLVVDRDHALVALVALHPEDAELSLDELEAIAADTRKNINRVLPSYSQINKVEILKNGFEHTPKNSIKRNLYS